jgi:hypothetical protein
VRRLDGKPPRRPCNLKQVLGTSAKAGHNGANVRADIAPQEKLRHMPSLFRFLTIVGLLAGVAFGGLYALSEYFEPEQKETTSPVPGVKVRR